MLVRKNHSFLAYTFPLIGGLLLYLSWYPVGITGLIFIAFVPFLFLDQKGRYSTFSVFVHSLTGFFLFHLFAGWWMYSSTIPGSLLAHLFNAVYMALVLFLWSFGNKYLKKSIWSLALLIVFWTAFEFLHHHWELAWPWFTLGHAFAEKPHWVQWYSFTGSLGGTAWILSVNWLIYISITLFWKKDFKQGLIIITVAILSIALPLLVSFQMNKTPKTETAFTKVFLIQPNINPTIEKFNGLSQEVQLEQAIQLMKEHWTDSIQLIVFPETMVIEAVNEATIYNNKWITLLKESIPELSKTSILTGAFTKRNATEAPKDQQAVITDTNYYVLYNSSLLIQKDTIQIYHKHQLVPLVEKQPFFWLMKPLQNYIEKSGGFFGRYGTYNSSTTFNLNDSTKIAPLICFESAFGDYTSSAQNGSSFIVLITNDGWWSSEAGYLQHLALARLRAIESGKWIVRSANTGVSAIIDNKGRIIQQTQYGEYEVLVARVSTVNKSTFYVRYGCYIGKIALVLSIIFLAIIMFKRKFDSYRMIYKITEMTLKGSIADYSLVRKKKEPEAFGKKTI